jgi:hypothetical protein
MKDEKVIVFMRATTCDVPNVNNNVYSGEEFNKALKDWKDSGRTLFLTTSDLFTFTRENFKLVSPNDIIGKVLNITDTQVFVEPFTNRDDIDFDYLTANYVAGMRYYANFDRYDYQSTIRTVKDIKIIAFDLIKHEDAFEKLDESSKYYVSENKSSGLIKINKTQENK